MPVTAVWSRLLATSVGGRPLAATRVLYAVAALVMLHSAWRRFDLGFAPDLLHVPWPVVGDHLVGLSPVVPQVLWGGGAVLLLTGVASRPAAGAVVLGMGAFYAVDRQHYANGGYFMVLIGILLVLADSGASVTPWGPDRRRASWWTAFLLACQLSIVYLYAAVQKLRRSSLSGDTVAWQLHGPLVEHVGWSRLPEALNLLGFAAEAFCAVALWFPRTRRLAVAVGIVLHLGVLAFMRDTPDLTAFGIASVALYPAFWAAQPPLTEAWDQLRSGRIGRVPSRSGETVAHLDP